MNQKEFIPRPCSLCGVPMKRHVYPSGAPEGISKYNSRQTCGYGCPARACSECGKIFARDDVFRRANGGRVCGACYGRVRVPRMKRAARPDPVPPLLTFTPRQIVDRTECDPGRKLCVECSEIWREVQSA